MTKVSNRHGDPRCIILGGGGHAKMLIEALRLAEPSLTLAVLDADKSRWCKDLLGVPILGGDELLPGLVKNGADQFVVGLGSTGDYTPRKRLFDFGISHGLSPKSVIHPTATCSPFAQLGAGVQLLTKSIVNLGAVLGQNILVNTGAIVEHDCVIGDHSHIATGARLAGAVRLGVGVHIGIGATVIENRMIGDGSVIGAGAVVINDVPSVTTVVGIPARPIGRSF